MWPRRRPPGGTTGVAPHGLGLEGPGALALELEGPPRAAGSHATAVSASLGPPPRPTVEPGWPFPLSDGSAPCLPAPFNTHWAPPPWTRGLSSPGCTSFPAIAIVT